MSKLLVEEMPTIDADFIIRALAARHPSNAWIFAAEVNTSTGYAAQHQDGPGGIRRIDAFAMALWPSKNFQRVAYEIKANRQDWLNEIANPIKRAQAWYLSNEFWFALAPDVYQDGDWRQDMAGCGLLVVGDDGKITYRMKARQRKYCHPMPTGFIGSLLRCVRDQRCQP